VNLLLGALLCVGLLGVNVWLFNALQRRREQLEQRYDREDHS